MDFGLTVRPVSDARAVVGVRGRLTAVTAPAMKNRIRELIDEGRTEIVCDLTEVSFIDSSGLAVLVSGLKATREKGGWLKLTGANEQVARIFKITMLDRVFVMHATVEAALA